MPAVDLEIAGAVRDALGAAPSAATRLSGGANNVVVRVDVGGRTVVAKRYFRHPGDLRDRLGTEFATVGFLWRHGVRCIPEPLAVDPARGVALYSFVEGVRVAPGDVRWTDALQLADLLASMRRLAREREAAALPAASEAHFSIEEYQAAMDRRLARVRAGLAGSRGSVRAAEFAENELVAAAGRIGAFVRETGRASGLELGRELPIAERTLSPADFGFHNVLRRPGGELVFLDFEYAGWDDPAVVLAQGCLAPGVPLPHDLRLPFLGDLVDRLAGGDELVARLRLLYPLVAFKWSMILLNEFLPVSRERRKFAGSGSVEAEDGQLAKSRALLDVADEAMHRGSFLDDLRAAPTG